MCMAAKRNNSRGARLRSLSQASVDHLLLAGLRILLFCVVTGLLLKGTFMVVKDELRRYESASNK